MSHRLAYYWMAYLRIELKKWLLIFICFHKCKGRSIAFVIDKMKNVYYYLLCLHKGKNSSRRSSSSSFWPCFHCQDHIGILAWLYLYDNLPVVHLHKDHRAKGKSCCRWIVVPSKKRKDAIPLTHFCHANTRGKIVLAPFYNNWIRFVCHNTLTIRPIQLITTLGHLCTLEKLNEAVERFSTTTLFLGTANHVTLREGNETVTPRAYGNGTVEKRTK